MSWAPAGWCLEVLDAGLTYDERLLIVGGNLRKIAASILRQKGFKQ